MREPIQDERGFALLLTLMVVAVLSAMAFRFHYLVLVNHSAAGNLRDTFLSALNARSGYEVALSILSTDDPRVDTLAENWAQFTGTEGMPSLEVNGGQFSCRIVDENRKVPINLLIGADGRINDKIYRIAARLFELLGGERKLLEPLLDWLDPDSERRPEGAENEDYAGLEDPYPCKNGPLETLAELRLVKGFSHWLDKEPPEGRSLDDLLTVMKTDGKININTADPLVIQALSERIDGEMARRIVEFRKDYPFQAPVDVKSIPGMEEIYNDIKGLITVKSDAFTIHVKGEVSRSSSRLMATVKRAGEHFTLLQYRRD